MPALPVPDRACERDRGVAHRGAQLRVEGGGGGLLEHLLVAALDRAVALAQRDHGAVQVGEQLDLDVPWPLDVPLAEDGAVAERRFGLPLRRCERLLELVRPADDAHAAAAAARRGLDEEREPELVRLAARDDGDACLDRDSLRGQLVAALPERVRRRADPDQSRGVDRLGEIGVLGEEAVAGMDRFRARLLRGPDVLLGVEVARDLHGLVGRAGVQRAAVVGRGDRDRPDPELAAGAEDAQGDLAAVRHQKLPIPMGWDRRARSVRSAVDAVRWAVGGKDASAHAGWHGRDRGRSPRAVQQRRSDMRYRMLPRSCGVGTLSRQMRRFLLVLAVALCAPAPAAAATLFVIDGRGWGHGVGMSQWGARGYAEQGWRYDRILRHYYRGTEVRAVPARPVRVLLAEGRPSVTIESTKPFRVVDARGRKRVLKPGVQRLVPARLATAKLKLPLRYEPGAAPLQLDGEAYRGALVVHRRNGRLTVVNQLPARPLPPRRRALGDARRLAPGGVARAGGGRALVRARDAQARHALRPLPRHAQPGLRRDRGRGGHDEPRDRLDRRAGRVVAGQGRDDLLSLDLGRQDDVERGGLAGRDAAALSRSRGRPVRPRLEAPSLGPVRAHPGRGGPEARRRRRPRSRRHARRLGARTEVAIEGANGSRRMSSTDFRRALELRSTWFTVRVLHLEETTAGRALAAAGRRVVLRGFLRGLRKSGSSSR